MKNYAILITLLTIFTVLLSIAMNDVFVPLALYIIGAVVAIPLKDKFKLGAE